MRKVSVALVALGVIVVGACGGDDDGGGGSSSGGSSSGGSSTGGSSTGGSSTGGSSTGGSSTGGSSTGGSSGSGGAAGSDASSGGSPGDGSAGDSSSGDSSTGGTGGTGVGGSGTGGSGGKQSAQIDAAKGGKLSVDGAVVWIGESSIAATTTIEGSSSSVTTGLPRAADLRGKIYDFTPNGTQFTKPGMLTLPITGTPPSGKLWYVAWLDTVNNTWMTLPTIKLAQRLAAPVKHFTKFAVLETNGAGQTTGCNPPAPCGGTLGSHYDLGGFCFVGTPPASGSLPFCPTTSVSQAGVLAAGSFDFNSGASTFIYNLTAATRTQFDMQKACVDSLEGMFGKTFATCEDVEATLGAAFKAVLACTGNRAVSCQCYTWQSGGDVGTKTGTYSTSGNNLTLTPTTGGSSNIPYCVQGGKMYYDDTTNKFQYVYEP